MSSRRTYQVKDVARIAGVSVRALHHYDELGLLVPSERSPAGYRLYSDDDLMRLQQIVIQRELGLSLEQETIMTDDMKPLFDGFADEARARWGGTDAWKVAQARTRRYSDADWRALRDEQDAIYGDAARAQAAGKPADDPAVLAIAERHRLSIERWFYPCSHAQHVGLADLYEQDPRFAANIDKHGAGLTVFLAAAIRANASGAEA